MVGEGQKRGANDRAADQADVGKCQDFRLTRRHADTETNNRTGHA